MIYLLDIQHHQHSSRVERWKYVGSGWTIHSILQHQIVISEITPCEGSSYFTLHKELKNPMNGLNNFQKSNRN